MYTEALLEKNGSIPMESGKTEFEVTCGEDGCGVLGFSCDYKENSNTIECS